MSRVIRVHGTPFDHSTRAINALRQPHVSRNMESSGDIITMRAAYPSTNNRVNRAGKSRGAPRGVTIRDDNLARPLRRRAARRDRVIGLRIHFRGRIGNF